MNDLDSRLIHLTPLQRFKARAKRDRRCLRCMNRATQGGTLCEAHKNQP